MFLKLELEERVSLTPISVRGNPEPESGPESRILTADLTGYKEFYAGQQRKGVPRRCRVIQRIAVNSYTSKLQSRILRNIKLFTVQISFQDKRFRILIELLRTRQMHFVADSALLRCVLVLQMCFGIAYQNTSVRICVLVFPTI